LSIKKEENSLQFVSRIFAFMTVRNFFAVKV